MSRIVYLHGYNGSPRGRRHALLVGAGHEIVAAPELPFARGRNRPDGSLAGYRSFLTNPLRLREAIQIASEAFAASAPEVLVATSLGAAVALGLATEAMPLVLLAPVWNAAVDAGALIRIAFRGHAGSPTARAVASLGAPLLACLLRTQPWPEVGAFRRPLVILHSPRDEVVSIRQSVALLAACGMTGDVWSPEALARLHRGSEPTTGAGTPGLISVEDADGPHYPMHGPRAEQTLLRVLGLLEGPSRIG